jgi:hypothetical protein
MHVKHMGITNMANISSYLQWGSALFAFIAAALWLVASLLPTPEVDGDLYLHDATADGALPRLFQAVRRQSRWNSYAAMAAAAAAISQGFALLMV